MLDVEVIKWGCGVADGFDFEKLPFGSDYFIIYSSRNYYKSDEIWEDVIYPLFLQRVIEGMNLIPDRWIDIKLEPDSGGSCAWRPRVDLNWISEEIYLDPDQAKEQAIKYIWEQVK